MAMSAKRRSDALAIIVGGARPKGGASSDDSYESKGKEEPDDEGGAMALQSAVEDFFAAGSDGDYKAAAKAFRNAMDICAKDEE